MLDKLINKIIIEESPSEYEKLGKLILESPIQIYDYNKFQLILKDIIDKNRKQLNNKKYAVFFNLKKIVIGKKVIPFPSLSKVLLELKKEYSKEDIAVLFAEALDQVIIYYIGKNDE